MLFSSAPVGALLLAAMAPAVLAQSPLYGQCGGNGFSGSKSCVSGSCCKWSNEWYSQCLPCTDGGNPTTTRATTAAQQTTTRVTTGSGPGPTSGGGSGSSGCGKSQSSGTFTKRTNVNGKQREYIINIQNGYNPNTPHRLAFGFHGWGDSAQAVATGQRGFAPFFGLPALANDATGLISVAAQGIDNAWANSGGQDIAFVDQMIKEIEETYCVNQKLRFATGFSYGGGMTYAIACARAKQFRAVAMDSGAILSGCSGGNDPIAFYAQHGVSDGTIPSGTGKGMISKFASLNGCPSQNVPDARQGSGQYVVTNYQGCKYPTTWVSFDGGHTSTPSLGGKPTFAPSTTWAFFSQFK